MDGVPKRFVVGIAESEISATRLPNLRNIDHPAGIAGIERPGDHGFIRREDRDVDTDTERQGQHRNNGARRYEITSGLRNASPGVEFQAGS